MKIIKDERLEKLKQVVGLRAYMALRRGAKLQVWRRTSPWNWWIENRRGEMLWHSQRGYPSPSLDMFKSAFDFGSVIEHNLCHFDGGKTESSHYVLRKNFLVTIPGVSPSSYKR